MKWAEKHATDPATLVLNEGVYGTTVQGALNALGGLPFNYYGNGHEAHVFELAAPVRS